MRIKNIWGMIRETFHGYSEDKVPRLAAALSYYTVFSLAPLLVIVIGIAGFIIGSNAAVRDQLLKQIQTLVGSQASGILKQMIASTGRPRNGIIATLIGIITLIAGATGVFGQLQSSLDTIWDVEPKPDRGIWGVIKDRFLSFTLIVGVAFLLLVSLVISTAISVLNHFFASMLGNAGIIAQAVNIIISIGIITLIFAMIFKVLPDAVVTWRDVWMGALVTAVLFTIGRSLLSLYLGSSAVTSTYGAAGSIVILLLWVYYSAQILFIGAEFTQAYAQQTRRRIVPDENARPVSDEARAEQGTPRREQPERRPSRTAAQPSASVDIQGAMMPVTGQPDIHPTERVRYEPPNSNAVIPVIAAGTLAAIFTVAHVIRKVLDTVIY